MDTFISYLTSLWVKISSIFWRWTSSSSTPENVSTVDQNKTTAPSESSNKLHPQIPSQYYPDSLADPDEIAEVDKINLNVKCAGKSMEVDMFPLESISVLLIEACERAGKKPEKMSLIYEGQRLDVNKTVHEYGLRGGSTVHLIHA